jgi:hypothetical protein
MILEIDSAGWVAIIGAISGGVVAILGAAVTVVLAYKGISTKLDTAATRREQIGTAIIDPAQTQLPPKEQP